MSGSQKSAYAYGSLEIGTLRAYAVYALALSGANAGGHFSNVYAQNQNLGLEAKIYLFKAAYILKQESAYKALYADIMNYGRVSERGVYFQAPTAYSWLYTSDIRATALALEALLSTNAPFPQDYKAVSYLNSSLSEDGSFGYPFNNSPSIWVFNVS